MAVQPDGASSIPSIRKWPQAYLPKIFEPHRVNRIMALSAKEAEVMIGALTTEEGIFAGPSSGGALAAALKLSSELENAVIVSIVCDRGDRYLSTGILPAD